MDSRTLSVIGALTLSDIIKFFMNAKGYILFMFHFGCTFDSIYTQIRKRQICLSLGFILSKIRAKLAATFIKHELVEFHHCEKFVCANCFLLKIHSIIKLLGLLLKKALRETGTSLHSCILGIFLAKL